MYRGDSLSEPNIMVIPVLIWTGMLFQDFFSRVLYQHLLIYTISIYLFPFSYGT
jgi:hypothetical protein